MSNNQQLNALWDTPKLMLRDFPSIGVHTLLSWIDATGVRWIKDTFPGNTLAQFLWSGTVATAKQDYGFLVGGVDTNVQGAGPAGTLMFY